MKFIYFIIFVLIFQLQYLCAQYITHNAGFEDNSFPSSPTDEEKEESFEYVHVWEGDQNIKTCKTYTAIGIEEDTVYFHSPDWFHITKRPIKEPVWDGSSLQWETIMPYNGAAFAEMGSCELIQQRFFSADRPLETGVYPLTFCKYCWSYFEILRLTSDDLWVRYEDFYNVYTIKFEKK